MKSKGFTLIELLVVIAIIGILASVVLASLNTARNKGADASIKASLTNMRAQAELWYDSNGQTYASTAFAAANCPITASTGNIFADANIINALKQVVGQVTAAKTRCAASANAWAIASELKSADGNAASGLDLYCVDSTGNSITRAYVATETIASATVINASNVCL